MDLTIVFIWYMLGIWGFDIYYFQVQHTSMVDLIKNLYTVSPHPINNLPHVSVSPENKTKQNKKPKTKNHKKWVGKKTQK